MKYLSSVKFCQLKSIKVCLPTNPVFHFQPVKGIHSMPLLLNPVEKAFFSLEMFVASFLAKFGGNATLYISVAGVE